MVSYSDAGVDVEAGERAVALMRDAIARATRPEVVGGFGGFAGCIGGFLLTFASIALMA